MYLNIKIKVVSNGIDQCLLNHRKHYDMLGELNMDPVGKVDQYKRNSG
jgi:hypothetical protein